MVRFRTEINVGWSMCVTLLQYPDIFFIGVLNEYYKSLTGHVVSCPVCVFYEMGERSRPGRGTSSQAPGQACHQRGVAPGESCDASGARDLSGEEGFRRAVRHSGSLTSLSSSPRRAHVVQSHVCNGERRYGGTDGIRSRTDMHFLFTLSKSVT